MNTILFDLDGTLLPMDQDEFIKVYFGALAQKCAELGYEPESAIAATWKGTKAMVANDGTALNREVFWNVFSDIIGKDVLDNLPKFDAFYAEEFHAAKAATRPNPLASSVVRTLHQKGYTVALATNPLFPLNGVKSRLSWLGLTVDDFEHVTYYDNSRFCKPNVNYYQDILDTLNVSGNQCMMIGNDVQEDGAAASLGMDIFIVTDDVIQSDEYPVSLHTNGSFNQCADMLENLPSIR